ncbi:hypothetical protein [Rodentibacter pneumotropicus]|uniref:Uncharacterized protein n=1 Tax=Rodentibacter pneumotropicus TaxID=758 RepID=A0A4S2QC19_9PAST|nr:hypothetical protein [Rodentibacter pneumotropicus]MDC2825307.1 hypothetical protein [Rodentibacter pneumotropicus]NBH74565.1 hypothetical protein [Rodentibacter pneumotropicus]OOF62640.1 hypothetical protein BH925_01385 [Rodentibacter pneumotropicus]TGZ99825.1 hypothetical protein D3M72_09135 [Rodentibacter pneumotropicus]THA01350.1 hypothetical protein D3M79_02125 [Rodentibacter pneumotropicus]
MKKLLMICSALFLVACNSQPPAQQDSGIYDMKTVQEYQARVASGNTVTAEQKARAAKDISDPIKMNASDNRSKVIYQRTPVIVPSIGFGYYRGYHHW